MPTASISKIVGKLTMNVSSLHPVFYKYFFRSQRVLIFPPSNILTRRDLTGEFQIVCPWLLRKLVGLGPWDDNMKKRDHCTKRFGLKHPHHT